MHVHFEETKTRSDCVIQALSWMERSPEAADVTVTGSDNVEHSDEGWLATGNFRGILGITLTALHGAKYGDPSMRTNFNLRGHRAEISIVKWNEPYQKLATCDITGVIFVWIKHEGRWSIELINDRNIQVTDFAWSHNGRMALIIYQDGFVLVGSVAGQRYWSSMLNVDNGLVLCGTWTPDDQRVMFGTSDGHIIVMSASGVMLSQVTVHEGSEVKVLMWSCERFNTECVMDLSNMENGPEDLFRNTSDATSSKDYTLAVAFKSGTVYLMTSHDDVCPKVITTGLTGLKMEWSNEGEILAVGGFRRKPDLLCESQVHFYSATGHLLKVAVIPRLSKPLTALTWGHSDRRLFLSVGCHIVTAWVHKITPSLEYLCRNFVHALVKEEEIVSKLPLPAKLNQSVAAMFSPTIKGCIPDPYKLREFVCIPPPGGERLYCTMMRHGEESIGGYYTLYLEYLGGMIPLLKGRRASKIRPEFIIYDPKIRVMDKTAVVMDDLLLSSPSEQESESEDDVVVDGCGSPRMQRRKLSRSSQGQIYSRRNSTVSQRPIDDVMYDENLPETHRLAEVMSNIWGTKFRLRSVVSFLPEDLGHVIYRTSLLHLQPRQMTVSLAELGGNINVQTSGEAASTHSCGMSESEDDNGTQEEQENSAAVALAIDACLPISPETPAKNFFPNLTRPPGAPGLPSPGFVDSYAPGHMDPGGQMMQAAAVVRNNRNDIRRGSPNTNLLRKQAGNLPSLMQSGSTSVPGASRTMKINGNSQKSDRTFSLSNDNVKDKCRMNGKSPSKCVNQDAAGVSNETTSIKTCPWNKADRPIITGEILYIDDDIGDAPNNASIIDDRNTVALCSQDLTSGDVRWRCTDEICTGTLSETSPCRSSPSKHNGRPTTLKSSTEDILVLTQTDTGDSNRQVLLELKTSTNKMSDQITMQEPGSANRSIDTDSVQSFSLPSSPLHRFFSSKYRKSKAKKEPKPQKGRINAPKQRRLRKYNAVDSSDEDVAHSADEVLTCENYTDLESFQKAQLKQKLKKARKDRVHEKERANPQRRHLVMHNKAPLWNEASQVYQLDFGGRVTQESAKNFQIEYQGKQVMQFGRIESNAYTLDFQHPFSALQAFAVALANVTQRLK